MVLSIPMYKIPSHLFSMIPYVARKVGVSAKGSKIDLIN